MNQRGMVVRHMCSSKTDDSDSATPQKPGGGQKLDLAKPKARRRAEHVQTSSEANPEEEGLKEDLVSAVKDVADTLPGDANRTTSELLRKLQEHVVMTTDQKNGQTKKSVSDLFVGLKVEKRAPRHRGFHPEVEGDSESLSAFRKPKRVDRRSVSESLMESKGTSRTVKINLKLFEGEALGIFNGVKPAEESTEMTGKPTLFEQIERETLEKLADLPAPTAFDEMITWTEQGILWKFPIDCEQGLDKEAQVGFHEHVFLDHLIEDFPARGPIRHFMELIITGLSKNPYLTVEQKKEHVQWFREYFSDKIQLVEDAMAVEHTA